MPEPIVNEIEMSKSRGFGDNIFGVNCVKIKVNDLIQYNYKIYLFPFQFVSIYSVKRQLVLEIGLFNKIAFGVTFSIL
tara:strand:+ start:2111 stop:2344 length:234 start_codon:yes stop_codon:yes gene_type:complete